MSGLQRLWSRWEELWVRPTASTRPRWMARLLLGMLAFDCWLVMVPHAARYGAGGFNVAHFQWFQQAQPQPSPGLYGGLMLACGTLALLVCLGALGRIGLGLLTLLYTWSWSMSQLDSYQHHYFLTLMLCCLLCSTALQRGLLEQVRDWGYRMLLATVAIVYGYTAISKMESGWRKGDVLQRIHQSGDSLAPGLWLADLVGLDTELFWPVAGHLVVASQVVILCAYLAAAVVPEIRGVRALRWVGWIIALGFHLGAEWANLRVGWFSWYMILIATVALPPVAWCHVLDVALSRLGEKLSFNHRSPKRFTVMVALVSAVLVCPVVSTGLDLPGAEAWGVLGTALALWVIARAARAARPASILSWSVVGGSVSVLIASACLWVGIISTSVRYDYYRFLGGDTFRRGELTRSHDAYGRANTYAPEGESRWKKVSRLRVRLRRRP